MNFQSLGFDGISQQERDANKRFYDSLSSVGGVITDFGKSYGNYAARKKAEEDEKRKWDNMLEEQKYRREQDAYNRFYQEQRDKVADQRYADELERNLEKQRREDEALAAAKKQLQDNPMYSLARIRMEYGQQAYDAAIARENAPTYADFMNAQRDFDSAKNQRLMYKLQKDQLDKSARQEEQSKIAENMLNEVAARENASTFNYNVNAKLPPKEVLAAYRDEIQENLDYLLSDNTPSLSKNAKIREYKTLLDAINAKLKYKPKKSVVDQKLGY